MNRKNQILGIDVDWASGNAAEYTVTPPRRTRYERNEYLTSVVETLVDNMRSDSCNLASANFKVNVPSNMAGDLRSTIQKLKQEAHDNKTIYETSAKKLKPVVLGLSSVIGFVIGCDYGSDISQNLVEFMNASSYPLLPTLSGLASSLAGIAGGTIGGGLFAAGGMAGWKLLTVSGISLHDVYNKRILADYDKLSNSIREVEPKPL